MRYQDYVIKDGRFIGKFEEMYGACENPWLQSDPDDHLYSRYTTILNMKRLGVRSVLECGCGLGYYSAMIHHHGFRVTGIDISQTAVRKAKVLWPHINFVADSVRNIAAYADHDAILFAEITWYLLPDLREMFEEMKRHFPGKLFFHNLAFYKDDLQKYGREFFTTLDQFIAFTPFECLVRMEATIKNSDTIETSTVFSIV